MKRQQTDSSSKETLKRPIISEIFREYLNYNIKLGKIKYIKRTGISDERPSIIIIGTDLCWLWFDSYWEFRWQGENAYEHIVPDKVIEVLPEWISIWNFSNAYQNYLELIKFNYKVVSSEMEQIKTLCDNNKYHEAMELWNIIKDKK